MEYLPDLAIFHTARVSPPQPLIKFYSGYINGDAKRNEFNIEILLETIAHCLEQCARNLNILEHYCHILIPFILTLGKRLVCS